MKNFHYFNLDYDYNVSLQRYIKNLGFYNQTIYIYICFKKCKFIKKKTGNLYKIKKFIYRIRICVKKGNKY